MLLRATPRSYEARIVDEVRWDRSMELLIPLTGANLIAEKEGFEVRDVKPS